MSVRTIDVRKIAALMQLPIVVNMLVNTGALALAGACRTRMSPGRIYATHHDDAPPGISACAICQRVVLRDVGRWWDR